MPTGGGQEGEGEAGNLYPGLSHEPSHALLGKQTAKLPLWSDSKRQQVLANTQAKKLHTHEKPNALAGTKQNCYIP